jgi:hypothetical protein
MHEEGVNINILWTKIKDIVIKTFLSIQSDIIHDYKMIQPEDKLYDKCFELLTFNIVIDRFHKPWLIKVD